MTVEKAIEVRDFAIAWVEKIVAPGNHWKRVKYRKELIEAFIDFIPDDIDRYDGFGILETENWDYSKTDFLGFGDLITVHIEWDNIYDFTEKGKNDFICSLRIAVDLFIKQSGGVVGYTVGDLRSSFDGNIPEDIIESFEGDIRSASGKEQIWL